MSQILQTKKSTPNSHQLVNIPAMLLVGGMGTRLRSVLPSTPKPLAPVGKQSFLELLIRQLRHQGIHRLVMCTGYLGDQIENEFGNGHHLDVNITYSREPIPLGTGGALKLARHHLGEVSHFIVLNGDSFLEIDFKLLMDFHQRRGGLASMAVRLVENAGRYGTVDVDGHDRVTAFKEKTGSDTPGVVNTGVYVFSKVVLDDIEEGVVSLERDVFTRLLYQGLYAFRQDGEFIDIGTPQDYERAQAIWHRLSEVALG